MPRRRRQPHTPPVAADLGPDTAAQRAGATTEPRVFRGHQVRGKRRWHVLESMRAQGRITERQMRAGLELHRRWCMTELSPGRLGVFVDRTPDPSAAAAAGADRVRELAQLSAVIPHGCRTVTVAVCCEGRFITGRAGLTGGGRHAQALVTQLQAALDALADFVENKGGAKGA